MQNQIERQNIWVETFQVRIAAVDRSERMTLDSIFNFFQETATSHAENLGVGRDAMAQSGQGWLLSRISVQVDRRPRYGETITVRTWPRGPEKLFAMRHFDIRDARDNPVVKAVSCWLIIDMEKRRPLRPQGTMDILPRNEGIDALPAGAAGLTQRQNLQKAAERTVVYTDLDFNGHVNNVSYIRWIEDTLDPKLLENASQMRLDINYLNETLPGETVEIWTAPIADNYDADNGSTDNAGAGNPANRAFALEGRRSADQAVFRSELWLSDETI
jgi:acyl-ACP thioesterase